ncbi:MAG: sugar nucleotide-binding protein [Alphaproteobacteria bacterium]|nr:sugar nucleotide-binding protein [Alphaproteobacteria bacterium]
MARIAVLGATGMLGHVACQVLSQGHQVFGVTRRAREACRDLEEICGRGFSLAEHVDVHDLAGLYERLDALDPEVVVNCAGLVKQRPDADDPMLMLGANALLPRRVAKWCDRRKAKLIQVSTDCVFSGRHGYYSELATPDPTDLYGCSKLLGEIERLPHLTLRTSLIGPGGSVSGGLFAWFIAQRGRRVQGFGRAIFSGLTTAAFARVLLRLIDGHRELSGLFHVAAKPISKYDLLVEIERRLRLGTIVVRDDTLICDRSLDGRDFEARTGIAAPPWNAMLDELCLCPVEPTMGDGW